jgi:hypothetical protein
VTAVGWAQTTKSAPSLGAVQSRMANTLNNTRKLIGAAEGAGLSSVPCRLLDSQVVRLSTRVLAESAFLGGTRAARLGGRSPPSTVKCASVGGSVAGSSSRR